MNQLPIQTQVASQVIANTSSRTAISQGLKAASRKARESSRSWTAVAGPRRRWERFWWPTIVTGFLIVVAIPTISAALYLMFVISDQFSSEMKFAVRGGQLPVSDVASRFAALAPMARIQDSLIIAEYVQSRGMVEQLQKSLNLRQMYSRSEIDQLSRFNANMPIEKLVDYWDRQTDVSIEDVSGIITVVVRAFTPEDALAISQAVMAISEKLVNELSDRSQGDTLRQARAELNRAERYLQDKVHAMRDLRNAEGLLDTKYTSQVMTKILGELRLELARLQQEYSAQSQSVSPNAPQLRVLAARINSLREQIRSIESELTNSSGKTKAVLAEAMSRFDLHQLERNVAEQQYVAAASAYETARIEIESQLVYLATFLKPVLAEESLYPNRWVFWLIILSAALAIWGIGVGVAVLIRNYVAI